MTERKTGFVAQVTEGGKVTIPHVIRKLLEIEKGDIVDIPEVKKLRPGTE